MGSIGAHSGTTLYNEPASMTAQAAVCSLPIMSEEDVAILSVEEHIEANTNKRPGEEVLSDSASAGSRMFVNEHQDIDHEERLGVQKVRVKKSIWQNRSRSLLAVQARAPRSLSVPLNVKARQQLRLPSFKTLGINAPQPDSLPTPPDESTIVWAPSDPLRPEHLIDAKSRNNIDSALRGTMPKVPILNEAMSESSNQPSTGTPTLPASRSQAGNTTGERPAVCNNDTPENPSWVDQGVQAVVSAVSTAKENRNVLNVLCHTQPCPCPLPLEHGTNGAENTEAVPTAFIPIITALQNDPHSNHGQYIEVTHAVPVRFDMARLPTSPSGTPNQVGAADYFSLMVFAKAVLAIDHASASNGPFPSSPHPVVAPSSVGVSILERFIPPTTIAEYHDLFVQDGPSVLVDRLVELSPDGGSLIFIYPTLFGATTFKSQYLGPILDPLLRTMVGVHGLAVDLGESVGKMAVVDHMLSFEHMTRRISHLLRHLNSPNSTSSSTALQPHSPPKYTLTQSSKKTVPLDRKVWTAWWRQQETPRIQEIMNRYFQRGTKLPDRNVTAGSLVREILDGVQGRAYIDMAGEGGKEREGIEVGVFILKRTA